MTEIRTSRLHLHAIDVEEGRRIAARAAGPGDVWADDYPFEGDVGAVGAFLRACAAHGEQRPFGYYRITQLDDGRAVGGIGSRADRRAAASRSATDWLHRLAAGATPQRPLPPS